jgi:cytoplasmic iron level regulating protein YaaA (DUF328/UPF0246 family)
MSISEKIAEENVERYKSFNLEHTQKNSKPAILAFKGDVYRGLDNDNLSKENLHFAQDHVRILSGLYGLLRPMDLIQPYRLEMGSRLKNRRGDNLYRFWGSRITDLLNEDLENQKEKLVVNLASKEYYSSLKEKKINAPVLHINFKEYHNGDLKFLSFNAKVARGLMTKYIIKNRLNSLESIKGFNLENYAFSEECSTDKEWLFTR